MITITNNIYEQMLNDRFRDMQASYGDYKTKAMWDMVLDLLVDTAFCRKPEDNDPYVLVDNYIVNSEIVSREEFEDPNYYITDRDQYEDFEQYAQENGIVYNDDYVVINLGF